MGDMLRFLKALSGNPKTCLLTEPFWSIPFNMFFPFVTLYMFAIGLDDVEIGTLLTVGMFANFIMALFGGVAVDKFGRRKTLIVGDFFAWSVPVLLWAFSQNFWWFLTASLFNSVSQLAMVSFECNWQDNLKEHKLPKLINWFHIFFLTSIFFVLIPGYFIERYSVEPVMRVIYLFAFVSMTSRLVILIFFLKETKRGKERIEATRDKTILQLMLGYKEVFFQIIRSKSMVGLLILIPMVSIFQMITGTFFALYATQDLKIGESFIAYFPVIRAGVALLFFLFIQNRLGRFNTRRLMCVGVVLYMVGHGMLLVAPPQNTLWLVAYVLVDAWASALFLPRLDDLVFSSIDPTERARCRSLIVMVGLAVSSPFGYLAGLLSDMDRRLPFAFNMLLFICIIYFVLFKLHFKTPESSQGV